MKQLKLSFFLLVNGKIQIRIGTVQIITDPDPGPGV
jgi:hypothetical protein